MSGWWRSTSRVRQQVLGRWLHTNPTLVLAVAFMPHCAWAATANLEECYLPAGVERGTEKQVDSKNGLFRGRRSGSFAMSKDHGSISEAQQFWTSTNTSMDLSEALQKRPLSTPDKLEQADHLALTNQAVVREVDSQTGSTIMLNPQDQEYQW